MRVRVGTRHTLSRRERKLFRRANKKRRRPQFVIVRKRRRGSSWGKVAHRHVQRPIVSDTLPPSQAIAF